MNDASAFLGYWKITEMNVWALAYIDLVVPGIIEFQLEDQHLMGLFQFGTVSGGLHCALRELGGETFVEWSWQGQHDTDPGCGRGWASLVHGKLVGRVFIYHSSERSRTKVVVSAVRSPRIGSRGAGHFRNL
jgi:hypothetical protein